jgi:MFS family permease
LILALISSYLAPVLRTVGINDPLTLTGVNAALAAWNMVASLTAGANSEKIGRRPMWIISNAGMGFGFCFIMGFAAGFAKTGNDALGLAVIPFIFIVYGFYDLAWIALNYTYVAEFLPYNLRTKGLALYITWNNISNAFNQFVNPVSFCNP